MIPRAPQTMQPAPSPVQTPPTPVGGMPTDPTGVAPLMISSLPPMASGADVYARQFYRGSKVPFRRYLPLGINHV